MKTYALETKEFLKNKITSELERTIQVTGNLEIGPFDDGEPVCLPSSCFEIDQPASDGFEIRQDWKAA